MRGQVFQLKVIPLKSEEAYRGWVRIPRENLEDSGIRLNSVVSIERNKSKLFAIVRGDVHHQGKQTIAMDPDSRSTLDIGENQVGEEKDPLDFPLNKARWVARLNFYWNHPDLPSQFSARLAIVSLALGFIALVDPVTHWAYDVPES